MTDQPRLAKVRIAHRMVDTWDGLEVPGPLMWVEFVMVDGDVFRLGSVDGYELTAATSDCPRLSLDVGAHAGVEMVYVSSHPPDDGPANS